MFFRSKPKIGCKFDYQTMNMFKCVQGFDLFGEKMSESINMLNYI